MKTTAAKAAKAPAAERIAHMRDPVRRGAGLGQGVLQLQRAAGNGAVNSLLGGLEPSLDDGVLLLEGPAVDALLSSSNARAAARGNQIAGERGAFNGSEGRRRLAHEAAHVLQQRSNGLAEGTPEEIEADADRYADARVAGLPARVAYQSPVDWHFDDKTDKLPDVSNQFKYETRKVGKETVKTVSGRLWKPGSVKTHRDPDEQRRVSSGTGEDAGHLIGNRFGAAGGEKNLSRQNWMQNRYGTFKDLENQWADKLGRGYSIIASVSDYFKEGEERPYKRVVVWTEVTPDGKQQDFRMTYGNFESVRSREAQAKKEEAKQGEAPKPEAKKAEAKKGGAEAENAANPPPRPLPLFPVPPTFAPDAPANQAANDPVFPKLRIADPPPTKLRFPDPPKRRIDIGQPGREDLAAERDLLADEEAAAAAKATRTLPPEELNMSFGSPKGGASGTLVAIAVSLLVSEFLPETEQQKNDREKLEAVAPEIQKELAGLSGAITELASKASSKTVYATITLLVHRDAPSLLSPPPVPPPGPIHDVKFEGIKVGLEKVKRVEYLDDEWSRPSALDLFKKTTERVTYSVWVAGEDPEAEEKALVKRIYKATSDAAIINAVDDWVHPEKAAARRKFLQQIPFRGRAGSGDAYEKLRDQVWGGKFPSMRRKEPSKPDPEQKP